MKISWSFSGLRAQQGEDSHQDPELIRFGIALDLQGPS